MWLIISNNLCKRWKRIARSCNRSTRITCNKTRNLVSRDLTKLGLQRTVRAIMQIIAVMDTHLAVPMELLLEEPTPCHPHNHPREGNIEKAVHRYDIYVQLGSTNNFFKVRYRQRLFELAVDSSSLAKILLASVVSPF